MSADSTKTSGRSQIWNARSNVFHHFQVCIQAGNEHKRRGIGTSAPGDITHTHACTRMRAHTRTQIELLQCALTWQSKDYISKISRKLLWVTDKVLVLAGWLAFSVWMLAALHLDLWVRRPRESWTGSVRESTISDSALLKNRWEKCHLQQQQKVLLFFIVLLLIISFRHILLRCCSQENPRANSSIMFTLRIAPRRHQIV